MALETGTFISNLVVTNPTGSDPLAFADDHLRLIKSTLKNTFPNVTGAVTKTHTQINDGLEKAGGTMTGALVLSGAPTLSTHAANKAYVDSASGSTTVLSNVYPVGSVYINATNAANPATIFGFGTWVAFGAGRVPVGFNTSNTLFNTAEKIGGSADTVVVSHTHTATSTVTDPGHNHTGLTWGGDPGMEPGPYPSRSDTGTGFSTTGIAVATTVASTGVSGTNANYQPFITVYMWKRTA